jgi:hypothetical protein
LAYQDARDSGAGETVDTASGSHQSCAWAWEQHPLRGGDHIIRLNALVGGGTSGFGLPEDRAIRIGQPRLSAKAPVIGLTATPSRPQGAPTCALVAAMLGRVSVERRSAPSTW